MKIALLADTHAGIRNDSPVFLDLQDRFYSEVFWPKLDALGIKTIVHLGDYFDRRKYINFQTLERNMKAFVEPALKRDIDFHLIIGNHDTYYKNTNESNSPCNLLPPVFNCYWEGPQVVSFDGRDIALVPWICDENVEQTMKFLQTTKAKVVLGHFEISGFEMFRGQVKVDGLSQELFKRFSLTLSGHFHHMSQIGNIRYLGSIHEATWADYGDPRGFHILDTDTLKLEFIESPLRAFHKVLYNDSELTLDDVMALDFTEECRNKYVRIVVESKKDPYLLEKVMEKIENVGPADLSVLENYGVTHIVGDDDGEYEEVETEFKDTLTMTSEYIDSLNVERKDELKSFFSSLYREASELSE